jgi:MFS family permease
MTLVARPWLVLSAVLVGTFMAVLDVAIVNVAIPSIREDLNATFGEVQLVISAYTLTCASLLVTGGCLGALFGRKRMFVLGLALFSAASAACGLAPSSGVLIAARALQGVGGALLYPQVLAIVQVTFPGDARTRVLGIFGTVAGLAAVADQLICGLMLTFDVFGLAWRPTFLVNVPLGALAIAAALLVLPPDEHERHGGLDLIGVVLAAASLSLLIVPLIEGRELGWPAWCFVSIALSFVGAGLFLCVRAAGRHPRRGSAGAYEAVPHSRLRCRRADRRAVHRLIRRVPPTFGGVPANRTALLANGRRLTYTPSAIGFFTASLTAPRLVPLLGRHILTFGYITAAVGLLATAATVAATGAGLEGWQLGPTLFISGFGQGLGMSPLVGTIIGSLAPSEAGAAAGVVTTTLQVGNALRVSLLGLIFFAILGRSQAPADYATTFATVLPVSAALLVAAAALVSRMPGTLARRPTRSSSECPAGRLALPIRCS